MNYINNSIAMIVLFSLWSAQGLHAQELSPIEKNWFHTYILDTSPDGSWVYYGNFFMDGKSTGHVRNIKTSESYSFSESNGGKFSLNSKWFTMPINSNFLVLNNLEKGTMDSIANVKLHHFSHSGNYLITQSTKDSLTISALDKKKVYKAGTNKEFVPNPKKDVMAMANKMKDGEILKLLDFETFSTYVIMEGKNVSFPRMEWSANGEKLGIIFSKDDGKTFNVGVFDLKTKTTQVMGDALSNGALAITNTQISVSNSGEKVYFHVLPQTVATEDNGGPEVWDTFDKIIYPRRSFVNSGKQGPWQNVWLPSENRVVSLGDANTPHTLFNPESDFVLVFDAYVKEPQFRYHPFVDLYAVNIKSGKRELVVPNQFTDLTYAHLSPDGNSLAYFKDKSWWLYDFKDRRHINLTIDLPHPVINKASSRTDLPEPYGLAGWSKNGKSLYLYDEFDVWKLSHDGKNKERITTGRESKINFRLVYGTNDKRTDYGDLGFNTYRIDDSEGLLFSAKNRHTLEMGYFCMKDKKIKQITWRDKRLTDLIQMGNDNFVFSQQSFTEPISIECVNLKTQESKTIYKSNPEWDQYKWPKKELIYYDTEIGDSLKGVLLYPIDYDSGKKYPMVVSTYTAQSFLYHEFSPPYIYNEIGFNYLNYALDGYFVLLPDIKYKHNAPGLSAAICLEKAVKTALNTASISENKIGLIGHSQGGYDTAHTITQTDIFAAAVAGSGVFNLESLYFDIYKLAGLPEIFRVEMDIFKMKDSYFENPGAYKANSPLHQAAKIKTPLLIWSGKEDTNVNPNQSLQMYLALRRLRKPAQMIYYEGENHVPDKVENRKDLTKRIKDWFDVYLK
jgi:dipeptidyl aminopeptidase/acylaminoacyl peptidase